MKMKLNNIHISIWKDNAYGRIEGKTQIVMYLYLLYYLWKLEIIWYIKVTL